MSVLNRLLDICRMEAEKKGIDMEFFRLFEDKEAQAALMCLLSGQQKRRAQQRALLKQRNWRIPYWR